MDRSAKLCVIGGGGVRTPFVAKTIATQAAKSGISELVLLDSDDQKLNLFGTLSREIARRIDPELQVTLQTDPEIALADCDYIITTVRAGGDSSRRNDELLVKKFGLLAQETTGACGFAMAMRSIPIIAKYCEIAKRVAKPGHLIFNFTNPAGLVTHALTAAGFPVVGICDSPTELIRQLAELMSIPVDDFSCNSFGLNHLSWFNNFKVNGVDVSQEILAHPDLFAKTEMRVFDKDILNFSDNYLLNEYLYFYYYNKKAIRLSENSEYSRAELIENVNKKMISELSQIDIESDFDAAIKIFFDNYNVRENSYLASESGVQRVKVYETPTAAEFIQQPDHGGYAGVALNLITALVSNDPIEMVLSVPNNGAIAELEDDDVIEVMCTIEQGQIRPRQQVDIPTPILNLIRTLKEYERVAVQAIDESNIDLAIRALTVNPLVANHDIAKQLVTDLVSAYGEYGGDWK